MSVQKDNNNFYINNNYRKNKLNKGNIFYNKSFKDLNIINNINNNELINNEEKKVSGEGDGDVIIENGMSQNEFNSNNQIYKNVNADGKENNKDKINKNNSDKNILINSQIEKKDKESVDNLKLFLNKLIDDLDK